MDSFHVEQDASASASASAPAPAPTYAELKAENNALKHGFTELKEKINELTNCVNMSGGVISELETFCGDQAKELQKQKALTAELDAKNVLSDHTIYILGLLHTERDERHKQLELHLRRKNKYIELKDDYIEHLHNRFDVMKDQLANASSSAVSETDDNRA